MLIVNNYLLNPNISQKVKTGHFVKPICLEVSNGYKLFKLNQTNSLSLFKRDIPYCHETFLSPKKE